MAISKQVDNSVDSHAVGHTPPNALPTSPNQQSSSSHAPKNQSPITSRGAHNNSQSSPLPIHQLKVPVGDGPYVRAKQVQLLERDPERAIALFWAAINSGDRVDSALKDMVVVMKQQNRSEEAIQAILSFRHLCSPLAQESLDNILLDLYKKCGRLNDQIELLKHKLNLIHKGMVFNGKRTKTARSQGKKFQMSVRQEATRLLGNLGWSYMQLNNYMAAEAVYRKALSICADNNKLCNLGVCLLKQHKYEEARVVLEQVNPMSPNGSLDYESYVRSYERAQELLQELRAMENKSDHINKELALGDTSNKNEQSLITPKEFDLWNHWKLWEAPAPNFASDTAEINDNHAEISTNPTLNHFKFRSTPDIAMQESYSTSKEMVRAYGIDDLHTGMCNSICDNGDGVVNGSMLPTTQRHSVAFKREIGPSTTVQQSKAKKNAYIANDDINDSSICSFASENGINTVNACWPDDGGVSPAMRCQGSVARRLLLDDLMQEVQSDAQKIAYEVQEDAIDVTNLDFTCVDRVIESIVPDAPSASQAILNISMFDDKENSASCNACALDDIARYDQDELSVSNREMADAHVEHVGSIERHQHRLRIFQDMTHVAPSCALEI